MLSRRDIIAKTALGSIAALTIAACSGQTSGQLQQDVSDVSSALAAVVAQLHGVTQIPANVLAQADKVIADIQSNAATVANALMPSASVVQQIASAVQALAALVTPFFPAAAGIAPIVEAALALIPVILNAVGVHATAAVKSEMPVSAARLILHAKAVTH